MRFRVNKMIITDKSKCCGCAACADACPKSCITMTYDSYGFYQPKIDAENCINCKKCASVCPQNSSIESNSIIKIFKGHITNIASDANQKSTSGAIFPLLAQKIIDDGGTVVGVAFDKEYNNVLHIVCNNMEQVELCRGSKYIQSQTKGIYKQIGKILNEGKPVLFSGTPCQVAALKSYLKTVPSNLFTVDFVCHGVGSTRFFQEYKNSITKNQPVSYIGFRDKRGDYLNSQFIILDKNNQPLVSHPSYKKGFGKAFANNLISRESCGNCKYATAKRVSDISLADNILYNNEEEKRLGSSFVFVNTEKGLAFFNAVKDNAVIEELNKETIIPKIMHLNHPAIPHQNRKKLLNALKKSGYQKAYRFVSDYRPKVSLPKRALRKFKNICYRILKK